MCLYFSLTQHIYCSSNLNVFYFQWFSSKDFEGRSYYFEENSNESSWTLPETSKISASNVIPSSPKVDFEDSSSSLKSNKSSEKNDSK